MRRRPSQSFGDLADCGEVDCRRNQLVFLSSGGATSAPSRGKPWLPLPSRLTGVAAKTEERRSLPGRPRRAAPHVLPRTLPARRAVCALACVGWLVLAGTRPAAAESGQPPPAHTLHSVATGARNTPPPKARRSRTGRWRSPSGTYSLRLRARGATLHARTLAHATPEQLREVLEVRAKGDVLLRVEGFANPKLQDATEWLRGSQRGLRTDDTVVSKVRGLPRGVTGLQLTQQQSAQAYAHTVVLLAARGARVRVLCPNLKDKRASALLRQALRTFRVPAKRGPR